MHRSVTSTRHQPLPRPVTVLLAATTTIAVALGITTLGAQTAHSAPPAAGTTPAVGAAPDPDGINGFRTIGYFPGWVPPSGGYQVADLERTGAVDDLTHLNYAFGNVTSDLICDISDAVGPEGPEGDPNADYLRLVPKNQSVDGVADRADQPLAGNLNQLRKLKERHPDLKILISLGGWTWSDHFSDAVATPENRTRLVESCVDLWIRGNLPVYGAQGGDGVAAGIFDGIDIDWEWPGADGEHPSPRPTEDAANFLSFMEELRGALDVEEAETGHDYLISGFAPAGWAPRTNGGWVDPRLAAVVDYVNVQGYDYHGTWVPDRTGHQGNLHKYYWPDSTGEYANWDLAADDLLAAYRSAGYRGDQVNLGLAAYGQGWSGVTSPVPGSPATAGLGTRTYAELRSLGTEYYDADAGAAYRWDGDQWFSLDTPRSVTDKAEWVAVNGYGGGFIWDITGDYRNELAGALAGTLRAATPGPLATPSGAAPWYSTGVYTAGDVVVHDGVEFAAAWWTRGQEPGATPYGPWVPTGTTTPVVTPPACAPAWSADAVYTTGDVVSRAGVNHVALWWTRGQAPGTDTWGPWDASRPCT
ncbi:glycoside hydrolase family 18 [Xylanimonas cellulosilytica DSM 15894]|uniref:chitinase n=1 Tax=Xylanimonas cellulosilytica (strain DSM 15894 / JCM 12276 / CECT 5975 / KCTC 9989 / LMG 20990 / NBRC 107835 / XIL07) TaxID=446471 RepID=D1BUL6_XYLCX|nr:glycosyl hydrolase family 18 protein [Xylanimonas cellulosilytica]ACZ29257.1 glycoside hydrolase family 18 [Xylanimonas cellulosilytica DSM 15894]